MRVIVAQMRSKVENVQSIWIVFALALALGGWRANVVGSGGMISGRGEGCSLWCRSTIWCVDHSFVCRRVGLSIERRTNCVDGRDGQLNDPHVL